MQWHISKYLISALWSGLAWAFSIVAAVVVAVVIVAHRLLALWLSDKLTHIFLFNPNGSDGLFLLV